MHFVKTTTSFNLRWLSQHIRKHSILTPNMIWCLTQLLFGFWFLVFFQACTCRNPAWILKEEGGWEWVNKCSTHIRGSVELTPVETCKDETGEHCHHGKSYMHSCFKMLHSWSNAYHADWCPKSSQICKTELSESRKLFFFCLFNQGRRDLHSNDYPQSFTLLSLKVQARHPSCLSLRFSTVKLKKHDDLCNYYQRLRMDMKGKDFEIKKIWKFASKCDMKHL